MALNGARNEQHSVEGHYRSTISGNTGRNGCKQWAEGGYRESIWWVTCGRLLRTDRGLEHQKIGACKYELWCDQQHMSRREG